jgi:hypothetical protein
MCLLANSRKESIHIIVFEYHLLKVSSSHGVTTVLWTTTHFWVLRDKTRNKIEKNHTSQKMRDSIVKMNRIHRRWIESSKRSEWKDSNPETAKKELILAFNRIESNRMNRFVTYHSICWRKSHCLIRSFLTKYCWNKYCYSSNMIKCDRGIESWDSGKRTYFSIQLNRIESIEWFVSRKYHSIYVEGKIIVSLNHFWLNIVEISIATHQTW